MGNEREINKECRGFCLGKARGVVWVWVKIWKCIMRWKVYVIKGMSCGEVPNPLQQMCCSPKWTT